MTRLSITSGAPWEQSVGYSRAVRINNIIEVSGTVAVIDGLTVGRNDVYTQTKCIIEIIKESLEKCGASLNNVIRTRMYVTNISDWEIVGKAHGEYFADVKPATSMIEVSKLIDPDYLIEIEATAVIN